MWSWKKFRTVERALIAAENALETAQARLLAATGRRAPLPPWIARRGLSCMSTPSLEDRHEKAESDLVLVLAEIARAGRNPSPPSSSAGALNEAPAVRASPKSGAALVKAPEQPTARLTSQQRVAAAFEKARAIEDPYKRSLAFADARRLMASGE